MQMMLRHAWDALEALNICNAMLQCGAHVVSVVYDGERIQDGALAPSSRFIVFAEVRDEAHMSEIDDAINMLRDSSPRAGR